MKTNHFILQISLLFVLLTSTSVTIIAQQRKAVTNRKATTAKNAADKDVIIGDTAKYKGEALYSNVIYFLVGRTVIDKSEISRIEMFANYVKEHPDCRILIEGYADDWDVAGDPKRVRLELSKQRALFVRNMLVNRYQIDEGRITTKAFGDRIKFDEISRVVVFYAIPPSDSLHDQEIIDGVNYIITGQNTAAVSRNEKASGYIYIADTVIVKGKQYVVTSIVDNAFRDCKTLTSIHLPLSITSIGKSAFYGCTGLKNVLLQKGGLDAWPKIKFADKYSNPQMSNENVEICEISEIRFSAPVITRIDDDDPEDNNDDDATLTEEPKKSVVYFNGNCFGLECNLDIPEALMAQQYVADLLFGEKDSGLREAYSKFLTLWGQKEVDAWKPVKGNINIDLCKEYEQSGRYACYHLTASLNGNVQLTGLPQNMSTQKMSAQYVKLKKGIDHYLIVDIQKQNLVSVSHIFVPKVAATVKAKFGTDISFYVEDRCLQILSKKGDGRIIFNKVSERNFTDYFKQLVGWGEKKDYDTPGFFGGQKRLEDYLRKGKFILAREDDEFDAVKVSMVILADGSPQQPVIESSSIYCNEKDLLELCEKMPKWKPAYKDGEPITKEVSFVIKVPKWLIGGASFPGGTAALVEFLNKNIKYPVKCEENGIQGRVICTFIVECDGSISNLKVAKSVHPALDKEAIRVLSQMPNWIPGMKDGQKVRVKYQMPVSFRLQ